MLYYQQVVANSLTLDFHEGDFAKMKVKFNDLIKMPYRREEKNCKVHCMLRKLCFE